MWLVLLRPPRPDAPQWPGRHALALVDAVAWPLAWIAFASHLPARGGLVGGFVVALACLCALTRAWRAVCENHRYFFTTWRWGKPLLWLLMLGWLLKLALAMG